MSDGAEPAFHRWLAEGLRAQVAGDLTRAWMAYRQVLREQPDQLDALCNLCAVQRERGQVDEALVLGRQAVAHAPNHLPAQLNLGTALQAAGLPEVAEVHLRKAWSLQPRDPVALSSLAGVLHVLDRSEEALELDRAAFDAAPHLPELALNLGFGLMRCGHLDAAEGCFQGVLAVRPELPKAQWNLAYVRLLQQRWRDAWPYFGARLQLPEAADNVRSFAHPRWLGEDLQGRTLLVWGEQGYGDTVQMVRFLPRLKALGARVLLLTYPPLRPLLAQAPGVDACLVDGEAWPAFDCHVPLFSLPALLNCDAADLGGREPYLVWPSEAQPAMDGQILRKAPGLRRIGLVWDGNPRHVEARRRRVPLEALRGLNRVPNVAWYSLQVPEGPLPDLEGIQDLGPELHDFADTAGVLRHLDAVVCVDTAVAHLAGALGCPTHLMLPFFPDWRWGWSGATTPWYATHHLYRQPRAGDWDSVVARVAWALGAPA